MGFFDYLKKSGNPVASAMPGTPSAPVARSCAGRGVRASRQAAGSLGGFATAAKLSPAARSESARKAATARWARVRAKAREKPPDPPKPSSDPLSPPFSEPGCCACCNEPIGDRHWTLAHVGDLGPFAAHVRCWDAWYAANYPKTSGVTEVTPKKKNVPALKLTEEKVGRALTEADGMVRTAAEKDGKDT